MSKPAGRALTRPGTESGTTLCYWHDGDRVILEGTLGLRSGQAFSDQTWTRNARYTLTGASYHHALISMRRGDATSYYRYDRIGSTRKLINSSETVTDTCQHEGS